MISIGMSNASQEFSQFIQITDANPRKNRRLLIIDAARDGGFATKIAAPFDDYWTHVDQQVQLHGASLPQVQVVWLKTAIARDRLGFPKNAQLLHRALQSIIGILAKKFPQLRLVYVSSRTYGGYSESELSPEPIAYESAFAVKWLIEERINNPSLEASQPWLSWGPYLWANGLTPRSDGLVFERNDFDTDGVHTSPQGALKVATMLLEFFQKDTAAKPWFFSLMM